jgi:Flp pilus assembly pilin Flp
LAVRQLKLRREDGVAMTEFALILPIFMLIVAGVLAFGRVFFYWIDANHLANETARWAVVDRNPYAPTTLQQHVQTSSSVEFQGDVKVCIDFPDGSTPSVGDRVRVRVQKPFYFVPLFDIAPITIRGTSTMRIERFAGAGTSPTTYAAGSPYGACS